MSVYRELNFEAQPVRAVLTNDSGLYLCAYDLCLIVKRPTLLKTNPIFTMCPSARKLKFDPQDNALWGIRANDVTHLFRLTENESRNIKTRCQKLYRWAEGDLHQFFNKSETNPNNLNMEIKIFQYNGAGVTFQVGDNTMINATEMAKSFGDSKRPKNFLALQSTKEIMEALSKGRNLPLADLVVIKKGGNESGTWMSEDLAVVFAQWLSPEFYIWCNDRIKELYHHGVTATPQTVEAMLDDPEVMIRLFTALKQEREEKAALILERDAAHEQVQYNAQVIEGLVENISLADMRQRINDIIRRRGGSFSKNSWVTLYSEFNKKHHINVGQRMKSKKYGNPRRGGGYTGSKLEFIEKELKMMPQLYQLTCKLFESTYNALMKDWAAFAKNVESTKTNV